MGSTALLARGCCVSLASALSLGKKGGGWTYTNAVQLTLIVNSHRCCFSEAVLCSWHEVSQTCQKSLKYYPEPHKHSVFGLWQDSCLAQPSWSVSIGAARPSSKRRDTWQGWKKEYMVWKCALKAGCYLASVCDSICPKTATHSVSTVAGWGDRWRNPSSLFLLWNRNAFTDTMSRQSDGVDKQTQNNKPTTVSSLLNMSVLFALPEGSRGALEVSAKAVAQCNLSPMS